MSQCACARGGVSLNSYTWVYGSWSNFISERMKSRFSVYSVMGGWRSASRDLSPASRGGNNNTGGLSFLFWSSSSVTWVTKASVTLSLVPSLSPSLSFSAYWRCLLKFFNFIMSEEATPTPATTTEDNDEVRSLLLLVWLFKFMLGRIRRCSSIVSKRRDCVSCGCGLGVACTL